MEDVLVSPRTWYRRMGVRASAERSAIPLTPSDENRASNASLVGANTVNVPAPSRVLARSALIKASTRMLKLASSEAIAAIEEGPIGMGSIGSSSSFSQEDNTNSPVRRANEIIKFSFFMI